MNRGESAPGTPPEAPVLPAGILAIRPGHGANCSSVGSVVDLLFAASVGAGALLVAVTAALAERESPLGDEDGAGNRTRDLDDTTSAERDGDAGAG